jgi:hypothetical protein
MNRFVLLVLTGMAGSICLLGAYAAAPAKVEETAPIGDLILEVDAKVAALEKALASAETFEAAKEKDIPQAFIVLTVMGQAVAEHADKGEAKFSGPALREAARQFKPDGTMDDARAALEAVKTAAGGGGAKDAPVEHDWATLVPMYPMMEEINARNAKLVPIFRRPRGRPEEPVHASTIAVLTLVMHADTHVVKNEGDKELWRQWSNEYRLKMVETATAVREKDGTKGRAAFDRANEICDQCHEKFRDAEE